MSEAVRTMMRMDAEVAQEAAAQADAGFLSAPGDTAVVRAAGWERGGVLLSRVAVRCVQRAVRRDSVAFESGQIESGADFCGALSLRGAGRVRLGLHECAGIEIAGHDS